MALHPILQRISEQAKWFALDTYVYSTKEGLTADEVFDEVQLMTDDIELYDIYQSCDGGWLFSEILEVAARFQDNLDEALATINNTHLEIAVEVAVQIGDPYSNRSRAEERHLLVEAACKIIKSNVINKDSEDIDEIIAKELEKDFL